MVIYYLDSSLNYGGQEIKTLSEAAALTARGHSITIVGRPKSQIVQHEEDNVIGMKRKVTLGSVSKMRFFPEAHDARGGIARILK